MLWSTPGSWILWKWIDTFLGELFCMEWINIFDITPSNKLFFNEWLITSKALSLKRSIIHMIWSRPSRTVYLFLLLLMNRNKPSYCRIFFYVVYHSSMNFQSHIWVLGRDYSYWTHWPCSSVHWAVFETAHYQRYLLNLHDHRLDLFAASCLRRTDYMKDVLLYKAFYEMDEDQDGKLNHEDLIVLILLFSTIALESVSRGRNRSTDSERCSSH